MAFALQYVGGHRRAAADKHTLRFAIQARAFAACTEYICWNGGAS